MKIDISQILRDYFNVIRGERWSVATAMDFFVLFGIPTGAAVGTYWISENLDSGLYLSLFTLFGVFIAVFMTILGVLVPLYHAPRKTSSDTIVDRRYVDEHKIRLDIIYEIGIILSYITFFCILFMGCFMIPIATNSNLFLFKWLSIFAGIHLGANLLILMKRMHSLIQYEFDQNI